VSVNPDLEILAVSSIVLNEEVGEFLTRLEPRWLNHEPAKRAWKEARSWYENHRESIPREILRERVPQFKFRAGPGSVGGMLGDLQSRYIRLKMEEIYEDEVTCLEDPIEALASTVSRLGVLQAGIQRETGSDCSETIDEAVERYEDREQNKGALGLPWPWAPLQRVTNGAQSGQYILIYARAKNQKTFILLVILVHWVKVCKRKVLLVTREMTKHQIQDRFLCIWAGVSYKEFRSGDLTPEEKRKVREAAKEIKRTGKFIVETVETYGAEAATEVLALCDQYNLEEGDIGAADGLDWFSEGQDWKSLRMFSQGLKKVALGGQINGSNKRGLVVIATGQANQNYKESSESDAGKEMSGGDGPIRDCDVGLKARLNREDHEISLATAVIREGEATSFTINAIPCQDYSLKYSDEPEEDDRTATIPAPIVSSKGKGKKGVKQKRGTKGASNSRSESASGAGDEDVRSGRPKKGKKGSKGRSEVA
jgi:hypothetical protein